MKDYYRILGLPKNASAEDIRSAYKKMARATHPDMFPHDPEKQKEATEKFKEVNEAWEVLSDPFKRQDYDLGMGGRTRPVPGRGFPFDVFGMGGAPRRSTGERGAHIVTEIELTLNEVLSGCVKDIEFTRSVLCDECHGQGGEHQTCTACDGTGYEQIVDGNMRIMHPCGICEGRGTAINKKCEACHGEGLQGTKDESVKVTIPPGIHEGIAMTFRAAGSPGRFGGPAGDLVVHIVVKEHDKIKRVGHDLYLEVPVKYTQLVYGCNLEVQDLESTLVLKIPAGTQTNAKFRMKGKGMPVMHREERGDFFVTLKLEIPKNPDGELGEILEKLAQLEQVNS